MRFTIRGKLILGLTLILLLMGAMGWVSVTRFASARQNAGHLVEALTLSQRITELVRVAEEMNHETLEVIFARTAAREATGADRAALERAADADLAELDEQRDFFVETLAMLKRENDELAHFGTLAADLSLGSERLLTQIDRQIELASSPGASGAAFLGEGGVIGGDAEEALAAWLVVPTALGQALRADADTHLADADNALATARELVLLLTILGVAVAAAVALWTSRALVGGVRKLVTASEKVSAGDADVTLEIASNDEIGDLAEAFRRTMDYHREHSELAAAIADGDLDVQPQPRSERDVLGNALARMAANLRDLIGGLEAANTELELEAGERRRAEEAARRSEAAARAWAERLRQSNEELEQFASVASHDLQQPLRMVSSYTQLLAKRYKGQLDEDADEFIGYAVDGADRMRALINDLLEFSRVSSREQPSEVVPLAEAVRDASHDLAAAIEESGATIRCDELADVYADRSQVVRLLQNLIGNAIKFRDEEPPQIHISAERRGHQVAVCVRDNGIGVDTTDPERIFGVFKRLHTVDEYEGNGIGLAICKRIVEQRGGRLWVESEPGDGSEFWFTLPAEGDQAEYAA